MADSDRFIQVPADGAGKRIFHEPETVDGSAVHVPVVRIADASDPTLQAAVSATLGVSVDVKASALPSGASTSAAQTTGNNSLSSIDGKVPALGQALAAASVPVVLTAAQVSTLTPPAAITGFGTAANQATIIGHLDGVEGLLTTIDGDTGALAAVDFATGSDVASLGVTGGGVEATALRVTIANDSTGVVSVDDNGGSLTIDGTVAATQSGTWTVQVGNTANTTPILASIHDGTTKAEVVDLATRNALAVAIVDAAGDQIASFGGGTQYNEDAAAAANPVGTVPILVRADTPAATVSTDGDNIAQRGTNYGAAYVTLLDTGGSPVAVGGGTQYTEGDTDASITGTAMMMEGAGNALVAAQGTAADGLLVNLGSNNDVTVTGTVTANAGSGTFAVSAASLPLPTGAATAAKQPALGTAGTASADVLTVQGVASMTALKVDGSAVTQPVSGTVGVSGTVAVTQSGTWDEVGINDSGNSITIDAPVGTPAFVRLSDGASAITTLPVSLASVPSHAVTNAGTFAVQVDGSALTALQKIDDPVLVDDAAFTPATSSVMMAGFEADEGSTDSVDEGDAGAARMTLDRKQIVTVQPHTTGGLSTFMASGSDGSSILVATAQAIKASAGQLYGYYAYNPEAAVTFVHFYNTAAASVTVGTTNPQMTIAIPAGSAANLAIPQGITFSNAGWSCAATTTAGGNTAPATGVSLVVWYS